MLSFYLCVDVGSRTEQSDVVLGPLRTALSIGARSTHPWSMMVNICTQLVDAYGNPNLTLPEVADNSMRLKVRSSSLLHKTTVITLHFLFPLDGSVLPQHGDSSDQHGFARDGKSDCYQPGRLVFCTFVCRCALRCVDM